MPRKLPQVAAKRLRSKPKTDVPRLLTTLLYGRFEWLERLSDGTLIFPARELAGTLQMTPFRLSMTLERAAEQALLSYKWFRSSATVRLKEPEGFYRAKEVEGVTA